MKLLIFLFLLVSAASGCQEHVEFTLTPGQQKKVDQHILTERPMPKHVVNANIEDQIRLIGYDIDKTRVKVGETFTITYYLEALGQPMDDNNLFVHFQGRKGQRNAWMNLDHHPVEGLLPLRRWCGVS